MMPPREDPAERLAVMAATPGATLQPRTEHSVLVSGQPKDVERALGRLKTAACILGRTGYAHTEQYPLDADTGDVELLFTL
jgi:hypothetical protein